MAIKVTKSINDTVRLWTGDGGDNTYVASQDVYQLRGGAGDDKLTGNSRSDIYIFEDTAAHNGTDTLTNFKVYSSSSSTQDLLDLSLALGKSLKINSVTVDKFVWVKDGALYVDPTGNHDESQGAWAYLESVHDLDQIHIRTTNFDGKITADGDYQNPDSAAPTFADGSLSFNYKENRTEGNNTVGTVTTASDDVGVTQYRFYDSSTDTLSTTSSDGYFFIDNNGVITMTALGIGAGVNNFDDGNTAHSYSIKAGDAVGNWSIAKSVTLNETNDALDDAPSYPRIASLAWDDFYFPYKLSANHDATFNILFLDVGFTLTEGGLTNINNVNYVDDVTFQIYVGPDSSHLSLAATLDSSNCGADVVGNEWQFRGMGGDSTNTDLYEFTLWNENVFAVGDYVKIVGTFGGVSAETTVFQALAY